MLTECRQYRRRIVELARGTVKSEERRDLLAHAEICPDCAHALDGQMALSAAMHSMNAGTFPEMGMIEGRVLAEFDQTIARRKVVNIRRWAAVAAIAAALLLAVIVREWKPKGLAVPTPAKTAVVAPVPAPAVAPAPAPPVQVAAQAPRRPVRRVPPATHTAAPKEDPPFVTIPYTVPSGPEERTTVVHMEIPVAALIAAGYTVSISDPGAVVEADVMLSQDGRARAIRPISVLASR